MIPLVSLWNAYLNRTSNMHTEMSCGFYVRLSSKMPLKPVDWAKVNVFHPPNCFKILTCLLVTQDVVEAKEFLKQRGVDVGSDWSLDGKILLLFLACLWMLVVDLFSPMLDTSLVWFGTEEFIEVHSILNRWNISIVAIFSFDHNMYALTDSKYTSNFFKWQNVRCVCVCGKVRWNL